MGLLENFERAHLKEFADAESIGPLKVPSVKTPDGRPWMLNEIVVGWQPRISDHWALTLLHAWIVYKLVKVCHVELPCELRASRNVDDPARAFIESEFGPGEREPCHFLIGRADFCSEGQDDDRPLLVEFGTCAPAKFVINLGMELCDHMIVPYNSKYAFVFIPTKQLISLGREPANACMGDKLCKTHG